MSNGLFLDYFMVLLHPSKLEDKVITLKNSDYNSLQNVYH